MPDREYITGVLGPLMNKQGQTTNVNLIETDELDSDSKSYEGDNDLGPTTVVSSLLNPALEPKKIPSTMGISFIVSAPEKLKIDVCVTWAKYIQNKKHIRKWKRVPRYSFFSIDNGDGNKEIWINAEGKLVAKQSGEISIHTYIEKLVDGTYHVSIYFVNRVVNTRRTSDNCIFQPQIRVVCDKNYSEIIPRYKTSNLTEEEQEFETVYRDKKFLARGHMTSVVWKDIDPEINCPSNIDFPECATQPGFTWVDGKILNENEYKKFSHSDVRTEFVPMYSIPSPNWSSWSGKKPIILDAKKYAEQYDETIIKKWLEPFDIEYKLWIDNLEKINVQYDSVKTKIINAARNAHKRLASGINFICTNDNARLAFCFANRAMDEQARWSKRNGMSFRPFQLAFILTSIESVLNPKSSDRDICDLLWVPTGSGKTEAYLFLVAMTAAYRRLESMSKTTNSSGAGVSIISRYTLRLLTTQQFRRTLSLFVAMEYLRVYNLNTKKMIGWRPNGAKITNNFLWGTTQFSVGLWVGAKLTPNKLESTPETPGALDILTNRKSSKAEPAQILNCPACNSVLAVPNGGLTNANKIHYVVKTDVPHNNIYKIFSAINLPNIKIEQKIIKHEMPNIFTLTFHVNERITPPELRKYWDEVKKTIGNKFSVELLSSSPSRPGYFIRNYKNQNNKKTDYDFEIFCVDPDCKLKVDWMAGTPAGRVHGKRCDLVRDIDRNGINIPDGNCFVDIIDAFAKEEYVADRIPIPAFTVDVQLYRNVPTMIVSTVDKFARLPFEPKSASLFGNVDHYHSVDGYFRKSVGGKIKNTKKLRALLDSPDLIIQDELHLIDGPLGSMVGIYETAIEQLCKRSKNMKYIASTATIKHAGEHIRSIFARDVQVFPPTGLASDDRFFIRESEKHPLYDDEPGRLYLGVCAPGRGSQTPIVRIWARLLQTAYEHKTNKKIDIDPFWTLVGYFNSIRELAGARALYGQDVPEWIKRISSDKPSRQIPPRGIVELSGRSPSIDLPFILERLNNNDADLHSAPDLLLTTSMFGTGVDVPRIGIMFVNGQPKTTSSYIQSTGRVGRRRGGIVVTLYRATRPRDLNHYEFFSRHHRQLQRFVESPTVFPFAKGVRNRALGPVIVGILRNIKELNIEHPMCKNADMDRHVDKEQVKRLPEIFIDRSQKQPVSRKPTVNDVRDDVQIAIDKWRSLADKCTGDEYDDLIYNEYTPNRPVVLGDLKHYHKDIAMVYSNAPQSMRSIEAETGFET